MEPNVHFSSEDEFAQLCDVVGLRLHYVNRVALGELGFVWERAELLRRLGQALPAYLGDEQVNAEFGDSHHPGGLPDDQRAKRLYDLICAVRLPGNEL